MCLILQDRGGNFVKAPTEHHPSIGGKHILRMRGNDLQNPPNGTFSKPYGTSENQPDIYTLFFTYGGFLKWGYRGTYFVIIHSKVGCSMNFSPSMVSAPGCLCGSGSSTSQRFHGELRIRWDGEKAQFRRKRGETPRLLKDDVAMCIYVNVYIYIHTYIHTYMHACMHGCMDVCMYVM